MVHLVDDQRERFAGGAGLPFGDATADLDANGTILSLEIMNASQKYPKELLMANLVHHEPIALAEAAAIAGTSAQALRKAIDRGRLVGRKIGRNYVVDHHDLNDYLNSRWQTGDQSKERETA